MKIKPRLFRARRTAQIGAAGLDGCILCGQPAVWRGVYAPSRPVLLAIGAPATGKRLAIYSLCERCKAQPDALARIESMVLAQPWSLAEPEMN